MGERRALGPANRRKAVHSYLRPLLSGRRVLDVGGDEASAQHLTTLGARPAQTGPAEVVLVLDGAGLFRGGLGEARAMLAPGGSLVCLVPNADVTAGGLDYYDVVDALAPHFPRVRMFGQTPFVAFGLAEFDEATGGLRVDSTLVDESAEQPTHYLAVAGPDEPLSLGYALVQLPLPSVEDGVAVAAPVPDGVLADLRRQLAETQGQADGAVRVSRAQHEELEELRARLRRAAEARADLDGEVSRLRHALTDADNSVVNLTRKTTEEMTALAQRLTAGLRASTESGGSVAAERMRQHESALAARESALSERDERIAALEVERQDLQWRLDASEEQLRKRAPTAPAAADDEVRTTLRARDHALEEHRRAAQVHVDEVTRLRDALADQETWAGELEETLRTAEAKLDAAEREAARLRRTTAEAEDADRKRRSRLAELEGTLLRMQRQAAIVAQNHKPVVDQQLTVRLEHVEAEADALRRRLVETERLRDEAERRWGDAAGRIVAVPEAEKLSPAEEAVEALQDRVRELEARPEAARLEAALAEVDRLRGALERSEEQLWDARSRILAERERVEALQHAAAEAQAATPLAPSAGPTLAPVLEELVALERGLRAEAAQLAAVERALADWRKTAAGEGATAGTPPALTES